MSICLGECPAPGECEYCNKILFHLLVAREDIQVSYEEWLRTSGPIVEESNMYFIDESWACGHETMTYVLQGNKEGQNQRRYYSSFCIACNIERKRVSNIVQNIYS